MRPSSSEPIYEAVGLEKHYDDGDVLALRGVSFSIASGQFVSVVGASGSGKTTLLQMLGALDTPSAGTLHYRGRSLSTLADPARYRAREIGFVFQAFHLLPTFTAVENVQLPMFGNERHSGARKARAMELLQSVGLEGRAHHFPSKLSGGERQRVAIARSIANAPSVLLADEPTGNLDSSNADRILELLGALQAERQMTLILVTHDMGIARRAERTIAMKDGRILFDGPATELPTTS